MVDQWGPYRDRPMLRAEAGPGDPLIGIDMPHHTRQFEVLDRALTSSLSGTGDADEDSGELLSLVAKETADVQALLAELGSTGLPIRSDTQPKEDPNEPRHGGGGGTLNLDPVTPLFILLEWMGSGLAGGVAWAALELIVSKWRRRTIGESAMPGEARTLAIAIARWRIASESDVAIPEQPSAVTDRGEGTWEIAFTSATHTHTAVVTEASGRLVPNVVVVSKPRRGHAER